MRCCFCAVTVSSGLPRLVLDLALTSKKTRMSRSRPIRSISPYFAVKFLLMRVTPRSFR